MSRKFRVGNDIPINWSLVNEDGSPYIVEGKNFAIELLIGNAKRVRIGGATASENTISFKYWGKDQGPLGSVNLIYIENNGKADMVTFDTEDAFTMVPHSWLAVDEDETPETITFDVVTIVSEKITIGSADAVKYTPQELTEEQKQQARQNIGAGTYIKPDTGIPTADMAELVQQELAKAGTAYQKPDTGIPAADMAQSVQDKLEKANTAYQKPNGGIPKTDLATDVQNSLEKADTAVQPAALTPITDLIPEQATPENKLADKNFVNSSIATNTANYISDNGQPFQSLADLQAYSGTLTNNDYAFVVGTDAAGNTTYTRYKYNANTGQWAEEYVLNNSSFTAAQWAAISSGITALLVQKLSNLPTEVVLYVQQTLTDAQKQQARTNIGAGTYSKPNVGIPVGDLAQGVQTLLENAGTAYQKPVGGIPKTDLATAVQNSLEKADTALQPAALTPITELIPEQATPQNQLADKNFVNSSVATNTANYISDNGQPFQSVSDLEAHAGPLTNNDYAFVVGTDSVGNTTYTRYKYNATTQTWAAEYVLNNSSFTAEQWAAISSGITALLVQKLSDLPTEIVTYVSQTLTDAQKQQARTNIGAGTYSKPETGIPNSDLAGKFAGSPIAGGFANKAVAIPFGEVVEGSTDTALLAAVDNFPMVLSDGVCAYIRNNKVSSASGFTLNINGTGDKPVYQTLADASRVSTVFNASSTYLFVYNSKRVEGGCWDLYYGYNSNDNTVGYNLRTNGASAPPAAQKYYRYRLLFTAANGLSLVPANTSSSTSATTAKTVNQTKIDPFGVIFYYSYTSAVNASASPNASYLWMQYNGISLGYSFNRTGAALTLTSWKPVYIKCAPQSDGSAIIDEDNPIVQALPTTADGKIYIFLGFAESATAITLYYWHPVYYYKDGAIRLWTNAPVLPSIDQAPTADSDNLVTSGGVYDAIQNAGGGGGGTKTLKQKGTTSFYFDGSDVRSVKNDALFYFAVEMYEAFFGPEYKVGIALFVSGSRNVSFFEIRSYDETEMHSDILQFNLNASTGNVSSIVYSGMTFTYNSATDRYEAPTS